MVRPLRSARGMLCALILILSGPAGCNPPDEDTREREAISGMVNFDGKPLPKGTIQFRPANPGQGTGSVGMIDDGLFNIPPDDGPVAGKYKVQIDARDDAGSPLEAGEQPGAIRVPKKRPVRLIPPRYNTKTELVEDVKPGGPNNFTFDLKR